MRPSSFRGSWFLLGAASLGALGCHLFEPVSPAESEPEEAVVESEGETEVVMTPIAPEEAPPAVEGEPVVSPREGVHETDEQTRGRLGKDKIGSVLDAHSPEFTECYASALTANPELAGRVTLLIVISPQGKVPHAHVVPEATTLENAEVHACVVQQAQTLTFEKPVGGRVVTQYPLDFKPTVPASRDQPANDAPLGKPADKPTAPTP